MREKKYKKNFNLNLIVFKKRYKFFALPEVYFYIPTSYGKENQKSLNFEQFQRSNFQKKISLKGV